MDAGTLLYAAYAVSGASIGLVGWVTRAWYKAWTRGDLVPKASVQAMSEAWKATDALREAARKEERDQLILLMAELREALRDNRRAA